MAKNTNGQLTERERAELGQLVDRKRKKITLENAKRLVETVLMRLFR